jgi:hypothetical protein
MVGTTAAILLAGGAASAGMSVAGGNAQAKNIQRQGEFNAQVYDQQAEMIKEKKKISDTQFLRNSAQVRGSIVAKTAGKGMLLSGSPLAILIDNESQMLFDKAIGDYNLDVESNRAKSGAIYSRETGAAQAKLARFTGYSNAFSTMLNTGTSIGALNLKPGQGAKA